MHLDSLDKLASLRDQFHIPKMADGQPTIYLCGNSLGLQPKCLKDLIEEELEVWATEGVEGHFEHRFDRPWLSFDEECCRLLCPIIGAADPMEIACMGNLSTNLHLLLAAFYRPTSQRYKILIEESAFPSDYFIVESQAKWHGLDPAEAIIKIKPRDGEHLLRTDDIIDLILREGDAIAVCMLPGVQFMTGQVLDMKAITTAGHEKGCWVGFDLAHAVGNIPLSLHDWNVDFGAWCSYKYLNAGPGGISGIFLHNRLDQDERIKPLRGWWGNEKATRFEMGHEFLPIPGARGLQHSNPSVIAMTGLLASLKVFHQTSMLEIWEKSGALTAFFRLLMTNWDGIEIITGKGKEESGAQLTLLIKSDCPIEDFMKDVRAAGLVCDARRNKVVRIAFTGLYNSFTDVYRAANIIRAATSGKSS